MKLGLSFALVQNRAGNFVRPDMRGLQAAASSANWGGAKDFHLLLTDAPGADAYPITATTFALMRKQGTARRNRAALGFFAWALEKGAADAAGLGYVPLPAPLVEQVKTYWQGTFNAGT